MLTSRNKLVSVVVPIYNTRAFLPQCIESIVNQSYQQLEVILVNDCSTDDSLAVCQRYACKDRRIKIINKPQNEGLEQGRFSGLAAAQGDYLMAVDSDDWLCDRQIVAKMVERAEATQADYVEMAMQRVMGRHGWIRWPSISPVLGLIEQPELFEKYYISFFGYNILSVNICGKLYRKATLDKAQLTPTGITMGEDLAWNLKLFPHLQRIFIMADVGYSYRWGGMTSHYNARLYPDFKRLQPLKEQCIEQYGYQKASNFLKVESKNVLRSDICQRILYRVESRQQCLDYLAKELADPFWDRTLRLDNCPDYYQDPFVQALLRKDVAQIYALCEAIVAKDKWKRRIKSALAALLMWVG